jgi:hypothetical protein
MLKVVQHYLIAFCKALSTLTWHSNLFDKGMNCPSSNTGPHEASLVPIIDTIQTQKMMILYVSHHPCHHANLIKCCVIAPSSSACPLKCSQTICNPKMWESSHNRGRSGSRVGVVEVSDAYLEVSHADGAPEARPVQSTGASDVPFSCS